MNLLNATLIGVGAFLVVKHFRDDKMTTLPYPVPGDTGPGGTIPLPGAGTVVPGSPGAGVGVVPNDPGVIPGTNAPTTGQPCSGCGGGGPAYSPPGNFGKVLTAPPPHGPTRPPPRDHRNPIVPDGGFNKPRFPGQKTGGKSTAPITCIRAPCPTSPKSGMTSPHHQSRSIQIALAHAPVVY